MAETSETSDFTSIKERIKAAKKDCIPDNLASFQGDERIYKKYSIPFSLKYYIELVETSQLYSRVVLHEAWVAGLLREPHPEAMQQVLGVGVIALMTAAFITAQRKCLRRSLRGR